MRGAQLGGTAVPVFGPWPWRAVPAPDRSTDAGREHDPRIRNSVASTVDRLPLRRISSRSICLCRLGASTPSASARATSSSERRYRAPPRRPAMTRRPLATARGQERLAIDLRHQPSYPAACDLALPTGDNQNPALLRGEVQVSEQSEPRLIRDAEKRAVSQGDSHRRRFGDKCRRLHETRPHLTNHLIHALAIFFDQPEQRGVGCLRVGLTRYSARGKWVVAGAARDDCLVSDRYCQGGFQ